MSDLRFGYATHVGRVRHANQDRWYVDGEVFAVADGMGGHTGGEVASGLVVDALAEWPPIGDLSDLVGFVHHANDQVVATSRDDPALRGMGTTISVLTALDGPDDEMRLGIANVGDSRIYRLAAGQLSQLTEDHSLVEALVRDGRLTPEEAGSHPQRNVLTRALGIDEKVLVDAWELRTVAGDRYLICSDGLFNELTNAEIAELLSDADDPQAAADLLIKRACDAGGRDNVTAVVVDVVAAPDIDPDQERVVIARRAVPDTGAGPAESSDDREAARPDGADDDSDLVAGTSDLGQPGPTRLDRRLVVLVVVVVVVVVLAITAVAAYARSSYYVGVADDEVVIYQGRPGGFLWFDPTVVEPVNLGVAELSDADLGAVQDHVEFGGVDGAREYGTQLALRTRGGG